MEINIRWVRLSFDWTRIDTDESQTLRLGSLMRQARLDGEEGAKLIGWPELAMSSDPRVEHRAQEQVHLVMPFGRATETGSRNAAVIVTPEAEIPQASGKHHPSPGKGRDPEAGTYILYDTPLGRLATMIGSDANYSDSARPMGGERNGLSVDLIRTQGEGRYSKATQWEPCGAGLWRPGRPHCHVSGL